jgi:hypothetical protein
MTGSALAGAEHIVRRAVARSLASAAPAAVCAVAALALAGCATLSGPSASDNDTALYATSQSNLASLSEVIQKHPEDPQAYNMRGAVYGETGRND